MAKPKMMLIIANLLLIRLLASSLAVVSAAPEPEAVLANEAKDSQSSAAAVLENINSLDFSGFNNESSPPEVVVFKEPQRKAKLLEQTNNKNNSTQKKSQKPKKLEAGSANLAQMFVALLGQLEKVDVKRLLSEVVSGQTRPEVASSPASSGRANKQKRAGTNSSLPVNSTEAPRERLSLGALKTESGNLLSITKQIVKLARSGVLGSEFGGGFIPPSSWPTMMMAPSMLSAASHMLHDTSDAFTAASLKSDWFWLIAPAVIVIGSGVIVIPLIAAWLVSHMMNQNTFTVSAGRRRRKRRDLSQESTGIHRDLITMLNIHRLIDRPQLMAEQLAKFHGALDSVISNLIVKPK